MKGCALFFFSAYVCFTIGDVYLINPVLGLYENTLPHLVPCHPEVLHSLSAVLTMTFSQELRQVALSQFIVFSTDVTECAWSSE